MRRRNKVGVVVVVVVVGVWDVGKGWIVQSNFPNMTTADSRSKVLDYFC